MKQFIETLCIIDGLPQHLDWHQLRMDATLSHFYPAHHHTWDLKSCIEVPSDLLAKKVRCTITYDAHLFYTQCHAYEARKVEALTLVPIDPGYDYSYKYADRTELIQWFESRGNGDDILMTRNGWITDTSIANIAFGKGGRWYTPAIPLLAGTTWKRLISTGILIPTPIHQKEIRNFESFKLFNALNAFEDAPSHPIRNIN